jgi:hypothetical protein
MILKIGLRLICPINLLPHNILQKRLRIIDAKLLQNAILIDNLLHILNQIIEVQYIGNDNLQHLLVGQRVLKQVIPDLEHNIQQIHERDPFGAWLELQLDF